MSSSSDCEESLHCASIRVKQMNSCGAAECPLCCKYLQHTGECEAVLEILPVALDIGEVTHNFWSCNGHEDDAATLILSLITHSAQELNKQTCAPCAGSPRARSLQQQCRKHCTPPNSNQQALHAYRYTSSDGVATSCKKTPHIKSQV